MSIFLACLLPVLFFGLLFYAVLRKGYVRASLKGPLASFFVEFEAGDEKRKPNN